MNKLLQFNLILNPYPDIIKLNNLEKIDWKTCLYISDTPPKTRTLKPSGLRSLSLLRKNRQSQTKLQNRAKKANTRGIPTVQTNDKII